MEWSTLRRLVPALVLAALATAQQKPSRAVEHTLKDFPRGVYFTIPAKAPVAGKKGPLLVVLPGGDGSRDFLPFVEKGILASAPEDCTGVLVTSVKWRDDQKVVWPTAQSEVQGQQWTTEAFVAAVVAAVQEEAAIDPKRIAVLAWSSSGPAVYPMLLDPKEPFARGYVAMSMWPAVDKQELAAAKGRRFVLDQSPDDQVTAFSHAREGYTALAAAGATVQMSTYRGGHGWQDDPLARLRANLAWLYSEQAAKAPAWPAGTEPSTDGNLLQNGGFEGGVVGWQEVDNSTRLQVAAVTDDKVQGEKALHLQKRGALPSCCRVSPPRRWKGAPRSASVPASGMVASVATVGGSRW
jgi:predicted esterase